MKALNTYIIERGPAPVCKTNGLGSIQMIQTILDELSIHNDCSYDKEKEEYTGKDSEMWKAAGQFLYDYLHELNQNDFKKIVDHYGWKKWIPDVNDIHPAEISMCVAMTLSK